MKYIYILLTLTLLINCSNKNNKQSVLVEDIVNKAIEVSGGERFNSSIINFNFRDKGYSALRQDGKFLLKRISLSTSGDTIIDELSNSGFKRYTQHNDIIKVEDTLKSKYAASVNSVHYFSVLPYGLNDPAVNKEYLGKERIKSEDYHKIKVTFNKSGGGEDYDDVFIYWINALSLKLNYLAYSYHEEDGLGFRFRQAYNERYVNGIRFVDYNNYKPGTSSEELENLGKIYENSGLIPVSKIDLKNIEVKLINTN